MVDTESGTPRGIALVTGASRGIGAACAQALLDDGWTVVLAARSLSALQEVAAVARDTRPSTVEAWTVALDVRDRVAVIALFNNAGVFPPHRQVDEVTEPEWRDAIGTNVDGMFNVLQQAFALMKSQRPSGGRIINNGSLAAYAPRPESIAYTATKHAVLGMTRAAALDGRAHGIAVGQIDIGNAATAMTAHVEKGALQADGTMRAETRLDLLHIAASVVQAARMPPSVNMLNMTLLPTSMPFVGRG
jgi:NADP-dependent 3-hydroxy acid dehydrogenase YdfG